MQKNAIEQVKTILEKSIASGNPFWNISIDTAAYLRSFLLRERPTRVLEIGTSTGYSAICMAEVIYDWDGTLITVESNDERVAMAQKNILASTLPNIKQVHGHAPEVLSEIEGTFDLVFLDATKYEHASYFNELKHRLSPGGIIIADNMLSHAEEMSEYKKTVDANPQFESVIEHVGTGLMISRKIA